VRGVEVRPAGDLGETERREPWFAVGVAPEELLLLLVGAVADDRLEAEAGGQDGRRGVDVPTRELLGREHELERGQLLAAVLVRDQRLEKTGVDHLLEERLD